MKKILFLLCGSFFLLQVVFAQEEWVRKPAVAGAFYPADPNELIATIRDFFKHAKRIKTDAEVLGLVSPHAGYPYSGIVAAQGYKQLIGRSFDVVIVISPSHAEYFPFSSVMAKGEYRTPLGAINVDQKLSAAIAANRKTIRLSRHGHFQEQLAQKEHALEVQLPFLQQTLGKFNLVAIVMGEQSLQACEELSDAICQSAKGKKILIVASSDLSHFHPYQEARKIDEKCVALIGDYNYRELFRELQNKEVEACGGAPIVTMLMATKKLGATNVKVLMYANSGDTAGDRSRVVGYVSALVFKSKKNKKTSGKRKSSEYSKQERQKLLEIARITIEKSVKGEAIPGFHVISEKLRQKRGAFVTINKFGQLRGCIGYTKPILPLYQTVQEVAQAAALNDPRFPPVFKDELKHLKLEISVLTLPEKITDVKKIEVGKHGLIIKRGYSQGLLLPQVAAEYHWDRTTFLEQTCRKAGLNENVWKEPGTEIYIFSAEVFGEDGN